MLLNLIGWRDDEAPRGLVLRLSNMSTAWSTQLHEGELWSTLPSSDSGIDILDLAAAIEALYEVGKVEVAESLERELERIGYG